MQLITEKDFDVFKSNVCHKLKTLGDIEFIQNILKNKEIENYFVQKKYAESLYLLAMVDYLCRVNNVDVPKKFSALRRIRLKKPIFPKSILFLYAFSDDKQMVQDAIHQAIPEFKRFNIIEGDIRNVI